MTVLILDDNLMWTRRLEQTLRASGHTPVTSNSVGSGPYDLAVVNLGNAGLEPLTRIGELRDLGVPIIGHAGHKEKLLAQQGLEAGCDRIVSNSELTFKLPEILKAFDHEG